MQTWRRLLNRALRTSMLTDARYRAPGGHPDLRAAIARHLGVSRSVRAAADDVLVTRGAQQAVDLVARVLVEPGDHVAVEEPGLPAGPATCCSPSALAWSGCRWTTTGWWSTRCPGNARLVYTTPSHQFPMGVAMSLARRRALVEWAVRHRSAVIEDDYDTEFRYTPRPLEPLQTLDRHGRVIYVGTFAKTMLPLLRTGFLVAPASLRPALLAGSAAQRLVTATAPPRSRWPTSSTRASWPGTFGGPGPRTPNVAPPCSRPSRPTWPTGAPRPPRRPACTSRCRRSPRPWSSTWPPWCGRAAEAGDRRTGAVRLQQRRRPPRSGPRLRGDRGRADRARRPAPRQTSEVTSLCSNDYDYGRADGDLRPAAGDRPADPGRPGRLVRRHRD